MLNYCALASLSFIVGAGGILTISLLYVLTGGSVPIEDGVVVDAGSTHSQVILYNWQGDKDRGTGRVRQEDSCRVSGGLADLDNDTVVDYLTPCLTNISTLVADKPSTSIFLGATAGFRLLNESDPARSESILQAVNTTFTSFGFNPEKVQILTGQEEGLFGWITANFLTKTLQSAESKTVGAMDLGGASTQIAFSVEDALNESVPLRLFGKDHHVVSSSSLCFGVQEAYRRHLARLAKTKVANNTIEEPCAPIGYNFTRTFNALLNKTCTKIISPPASPQGVQDAANYTFIGTGNSSQCQERVASLFDWNNCSKEYGENLCFSNVSVPTEGHEYYAFSSFFYTASFLNATDVSLSDFQNASQILCEKPWEEVEQMNTTDSSSLPRFCFQALFMEHMLTKVYLFDNTTWKNIHFKKQVDNTDVGWSLGYMINSTNAIPAEKPSDPSLGLAPFVILLVLCLLLLALSVVFFRRYRKAPTDISYIQV